MEANESAPTGAGPPALPADDAAQAHAVAAESLNRRRLRGERVSLETLADHLAHTRSTLDGCAVAVLREAAATVAERPDQAGRRCRWLAAALARMPRDAPDRIATVRDLVDAYVDAREWAELVALLDEEPASTRVTFVDELLRALHRLHRYDAALTLIDSVLEIKADTQRVLQRAQTLLLLERFDNCARALRSVSPAEGNRPADIRIQVGLITVAALRSDVTAVHELGMQLGRQLDVDELRDAVELADFVAVERALVGGALEPAVGRRSGTLTTVRHAYAAGHWDNALRAGGVRLAAAVEEFVGETDGEIFGLRVLCAQILLHRGQLSSAEELLGPCEFARPGGLALVAARSELLHAQGQLEAARNTIRRGIDHARAKGYRAGMSALLAALIEIELTSTGCTAEVVREHLLALQAAAEAGTRTDQACAARAVALVRHDPRAAREAAALCASRPFDQARNLLLAATLDRTDADSAIHAHRTFAALGADRLRRETSRLLRVGGVAVPRTPARSPAVSFRRHRVVRLVADGHTNRQIATELGVSVKTVESDLTALYVLTGCRSRAMLARAYAGDLARGPIDVTALISPTVTDAE